MGGAASAIIGFTNLGLGFVGLALQATQIDLDAKAQQYINQMHKLGTDNQHTIDQYKKMQDLITITASPVLKNQLSKVQKLLNINIEDIKIYFQYLRAISSKGKLYKFSYNQLQAYLPGTVPIWNWYSNQTFLFSQLALTVLAMHDAYVLYNRWIALNNSGGKGDPSDVPNKVPNERTYLLERIRSISTGDSSSVNLTTDIVDYGTFSASITKTVDNSATQQNKANEGSMTMADKIMNIGGLILNIIGIGYAIYNIVQKTNQVQAAKHQLQEMQNKIKLFYKQIAGILQKIEAFLQDFKLQIASFWVFIKQVVTIAQFTLLVVQNPQDFKPEINSLNIDQQINQNVLLEIETSKSSLSEAMKGFNIQQKHQDLSKRLQKVVKVFQNLDTKIKISNIYNTFYQKLKIAQTLEQGLRFNKARALAQFVETVGTIIAQNISQPEFLKTIEQIYKNTEIFAASGQKQLTQKDKKMIAMVISVFTINYKGQTSFYGYKLADFNLPIDPIDKPIQNILLQDIDSGPLMPIWVQKTTPISKKNINQKKGVDPKNLSYLRTILIVENRGTLAERNDVALRVQIFSDQNTRYFVLYDFTTNIFSDVRVGKI